MEFFMPLFILIFIAMMIAHSVYVHMNSKKLKALFEAANSKQGEQKVLLSSLLGKFEKMYIYREAIVSADTKEVKDLFGELIDDEDKHLKILKKALVK
ncbi:MAG: hypothetical protein OEV42_14090 [Deltaproteobacteria bacterium]|nr:hypothetical protein [Deltaproteobacteria bacterium]